MFNAQLGAPSHLVGLLGIANIVLDLATVGLATKPPSSATRRYPPAKRPSMGRWPPRPRRAARRQPQRHLDRLRDLDASPAELGPQEIEPTQEVVSHQEVDDRGSWEPSASSSW